jgi:hypothetical protein
MDLNFYLLWGCGGFPESEGGYFLEGLKPCSASLRMLSDFATTTKLKTKA